MNIITNTHDYRTTHMNSNSVADDNKTTNAHDDIETHKRWNSKPISVAKWSKTTNTHGVNAMNLLLKRDKYTMVYHGIPFISVAVDYIKLFKYVGVPYCRTDRKMDYLLSLGVTGDLTNHKIVIS